ncbi:hypothetical protein OFM39_34990, partial [Escherichia coli]|nr:hypothetical protein [Escherichia coli]
IKLLSFTRRVKLLESSIFCSTDGGADSVCFGTWWPAGVPSLGWASSLPTPSASTQSDTA